MLHRHAFPAMGCDMLAVVACEAEAPPAVLDHVPGWFEAWEQVLSRFRPDSELSELNRTSDQAIQVSETLWDVYQAALWADAFTGGLVRPTVGEALLQAGYDRSFEHLSRYQQGELAVGGHIMDPLSVIAVEEKSRSICLPPCVKLDLGGVAKGWAAHQAMLKLAPVGPALVDAGGDIAISESLSGGKPWQVGVSNPFDAGQELVTLYLGACGVATSGKDRRHWVRNGRFQHHIIDPRSGAPAQSDVLTATVVARTVMEAEAAAKAVVILGSQAGISWLEEDETLAGLVVLQDGEVLCNARMEQHL